MAKFAEINSLNEVLKIIDINDQDIIDNGGHQSTEVAQFIETIIPLSDSGVKWVEMTDDGSFRKQGAVVGGTYDSIKDKFINPKPYPSWILNVNDDWESQLEIYHLLLQTVVEIIIIGMNPIKVGIKLTSYFRF